MAMEASDLIYASRKSAIRICKARDEVFAEPSERSRLYRLKPEGTNTPWVESLTSYITRLADAHSVHVATLIKKEIMPALPRERNLLYGSALAGSFWRKAVSLDGMGEWNRDFTTALARLTGRPELTQLSMHTWKNVVSYRGLLRRVRAWCPLCFEDWRVAEKVVYEPLICRLKAITHCPRHSILLREKCPHAHCESTMPVLSATAVAGCCHKCRGWLGQTVDEMPTSSSKCLDSEIARQHKIAAGVGEMIKSAPAHLEPLPHHNLQKSFASYVTVAAQNDLSRFAHITGVSRRSIEDLVSGTQTPQLHTLLHICQALGTTPVEFLAGRVRSYHPVEGTSARRRSPGTITHLRPFNERAIGEALEAELSKTEEPPRSLTEVARSLGYDPSYVSIQLPELCKRISRRYTKYRIAARIERIEELRTEVRTATASVHALGLYPSYRRVAAKLNRPRQMREKEAITAWHEMLIELGWRLIL
jgi:transcriptional regulator with XRE-family HTH domain